MVKPAVAAPAQAKPAVAAPAAKAATATATATATAGGKSVAAPVIAPAAPKPPPFQISSVHEAQRWLKLFVYANYGVGKTRLAGSSALVPQMQDVLMVDAEAGDLTIATDEGIEISGEDTRIDRVRCPDFKTFARLQEFLKVHCMFRDTKNDAKLKELEAKLRSDFNPDEPPRRYKTVIIDSLTEIETFSMYGLLGITDRTALDEETASAEWGEFKRNNTQILRAVRAFRDLPINLIVTSAAAYVQNDAKKMIWQPALTGKLAKQVQGFMDVVGFMAMVNGGEGVGEVRRMFVQPGSNYDAKCRFSNYKERYFDNPTIHSILAAVGLLEQPSK